MRRTRFLLFAPLTLALVVVGGLAASPLGLAATDVPARLTNQEFWQLTEDLSEPDGTFSSDNLLSNERVFARLVPELVAKAKPGGVYLGVGPEQNFTYIAAIKPRIAFITDIRRGNLHLQLMYKALFELSADRAEFVSRLFTKPRPASLTRASTATELMDAYWDAWTSNEAAYAANLQAITDHLTKTRALPLSATDLEGIGRVYRTFYWYGPMITWSARTSSVPPPSAGAPNLAAVAGTTIPLGTTYRDLMIQADPAGQVLSYLASEETFAVVKDLEARNLIVPVVGDFSGPKALRGVGAYLKAHDATVTAFYLSNVEGYLQRGFQWPAFCANVAAMPLDDASVFIRPNSAGNVPTIGARQPLTFAIITRDPVTGAITVTQQPTPTITPLPTSTVPPTPTTTPAPTPTATPAATTPSAAPSRLTGLVPMAAEVRACAPK